MSQYIAGGTPVPHEDAIQEFTAAGDLIFQLPAWNHIQILDEQAFIGLTSSSFDFTHMNSIDVDTDGNIPLSSATPVNAPRLTGTPAISSGGWAGWKAASRSRMIR